MDFGEIPDHRCSAGLDVVEKSRKELMEDPRPAGDQQMGVPTLGHTSPIPDCLQERVAFHDRHLLVRVGQHARGEKPGHAAPEDHRVVADPPHLDLPRRDLSCDARA
jgi:hypothetical protein